MRVLIPDRCETTPRTPRRSAPTDRRSAVCSRTSIDAFRAALSHHRRARAHPPTHQILRRRRAGKRLESDAGPRRRSDDRVRTFRRVSARGRNSLEQRLCAPQHSLTHRRTKPYNPKVCLSSRCPIPSPAVRHFVTRCDASRAGSSSPRGSSPRREVSAGMARRAFRPARGSHQRDRGRCLCRGGRAREPGLGGRDAGQPRSGPRQSRSC